MSTDPKNTIKLVKTEAESAFNRQVNETISALKAATPKKTGFASRQWRALRYKIGETKPVMINDAPYIDALDNGHSRQQPTPGWIARVIAIIEAKFAPKSQ